MKTSKPSGKRGSTRGSPTFSYIGAGFLILLVILGWVFGLAFRAPLTNLAEMITSQTGVATSTQVASLHRDLLLAGGAFSLVLLLVAGAILLNAAAQAKALHALRSSQDALEKRLQERTAQLSSLNLVLQKEINERSQTEQSLLGQRAILDMIQHGVNLLNAEDFHKGLDHLVGQLGMGIGAEQACLVQLDRSVLPWRIILKYEWHPAQTNRVKTPYVLLHSPDDRAQAQWMETLQGNHPFLFNHQDQDTDQLVMLMDIPVFTGNELWGIFEFIARGKQTKWGGTEIHALTMLAAMVSAGLQSFENQDQGVFAAQTNQRSAELFADIILRQSPNGIITYASPTSQRLLGYSPEELSGRRHQNFIHPDDIEEMLRLTRLIEQTGSPQSTTYRFRHKNDQFVWLETTGGFQQRNQQQELVFVSRDISNRIKIEQALRESGMKFRGIVEQSMDGIALSDEEGYVCEWNRSMEMLTGMKREQAVGILIWDVFFNHLFPQSQRSPQTYERMRAGYLTLQENGQSSSNATRQLLRIESNAGFHTVQTNTYPIRTEKGYMVCTVCQDISERMAIEDSFQRVHSLLSTLMDHSPDIIYVKDRFNRFVIANDAVVRFLGVSSAADILGKNEQDFLPPQYANPMIADDQLVIQKGETIQNREMAVPDAGGNTAWFSITKLPLRDANGHIAGVVGVLKNITPQHASEESLRLANLTLYENIASLERKNTEITLLNEFGDLLQGCRNEAEIYTVFTNFAPRLFPELSGSLYLFSQNRLEPLVSWGDAFFGDRIFTRDACWALRRSRMHIVAEPTNRLHCQHVNANPDAGFIPYICQPMNAQGEVVGLLHVQGTPDANMHQWAPLTRTLSERMAMSIANLRLREDLHTQAIRDPLTNLFNRRFMEESLEREVHRAIRHNRPLGLIMLDIDNFKLFNDTFSYAAGDLLLRELGMFLENSLRKGDVNCRYGGDEFLLILPESTLQDTVKRAEQIRNGIKRLHIIHEGQALGMITVSLGISGFPAHGQTVEGLLHAVDTALHAAKNLGRDQLVVAKEA